MFNWRDTLTMGLVTNRAIHLYKRVPAGFKMFIEQLSYSIATCWGQTAWGYLCVSSLFPLICTLSQRRALLMYKIQDYTGDGST